jgi:hypothetical protein
VWFQRPFASGYSQKAKANVIRNAVFSGKIVYCDNEDLRWHSAQMPVTNMRWPRTSK